MKKGRLQSLSVLFIVLFGLLLLVFACGTASSVNGYAAPNTASSSDDRESVAPAAAPSSADSKDKAEKRDELGLSGGSGGSSEESSVADASGSTAASTLPKESIPSTSGLKAGFSDDNEQYNYFVNFLSEYGTRAKHIEMDVTERIAINVMDVDGKSIANADVTVTTDKGKVVTSGKTYANGCFYIFAKDYPQASGVSSFVVTVAAFGQTKKLSVARNGPLSIELRFDVKRVIPKAIPIDIVFILDTTGSMGEEIERLKAFMEIIYSNLSETAPKPILRFGLVLYRDKRDQYVTLDIPLTSDLAAFQSELDKVTAGGGGDTPEDLNSALDDTLNKMDWNKDGIRLGFIITDAPPHLNYEQSYTYTDASRDAKARAIKLHTIGAGDLPLDGEYVLRQISQYTSGRYIFLTYGERGESEGGKAGSVSHHTGSNYQTDKLESIIIKFAREEMSYMSDQPVTKGDDYFDAKKFADEQKEETLKQLFTQAFQSLFDYSTMKVTKETKLALLPVVASGSDDELKTLKVPAEYATAQLELFAAQCKIFTFVTRNSQDMAKILKEQEFQLSGIVDINAAVKVGKFLSVDVLVFGTLFKKGDSFELYLKLVRVETGEILAVSKARLDAALLQ